MDRAHLEDGQTFLATINGKVENHGFRIRHADMEASIDLFLGMFLLVRGWLSGFNGTIMTVGAVTEMSMTVPAVALNDAAKRKRLLSSFLGFASDRVVHRAVVAEVLAGLCLRGRHGDRRCCDRPRGLGHHARRSAR
jgi:hypothetical protein